MSILRDFDQKFRQGQASYMMVTILAMLDLCPPFEGVALDDVVSYFQGFYESRQRYGKVPEKDKQRMASVLSMSKGEIRSLMLRNPLEALRDFIVYAPDKGEVRFADGIAEELSDNKIREELRNLAYERLYQYYKRFCPHQLTLQELNDLPLGVAVTATDVALLSGQNQVKGIHPIEREEFKGVIVLCTIGGDHYANEWLNDEKSRLKYYLEGRTDGGTGHRSYNLDLPSNKAVIESRQQGYPILVFTRNKKGELFHYAGKFSYGQVGEDGSGDIYVILKREEDGKMGIPDVERGEIIKALQTFDHEHRDSAHWRGWEKRKNQKYAIFYKDRLYPPKQIISLATGLHVSRFSGGEQSNSYLRKRGFEIIFLPDHELPPSNDVSNIVNRVFNYIREKGFIFKKDLLHNFFLSLKAKPFVILAGISGTGKTKLIELFAEALGATISNGRFELIPVRPDWNDSSDLLGYKDLEGKFRPGPLTKVIQRAIREKDKPYFICLDEMNLARVEYYLSDFLSLLETRRFYHKELQSSPVFRETDFAFEEDRREFSGLYIPGNLYVVGTVNMDETTHPFSKKVLDRANTIEFTDVYLKAYGLPTGPGESSEDNPGFPEINNGILQSEFCVLRDCLPQHKGVVDDVVSNLMQINDILRAANLHVGYRVRDEISFYMVYNEKYGLMDQDVAFDWQLLQKILPRIQGSSHKIYEVLVRLFELCTNTSLESEHEGASEEAEKILENTQAKWPRSARKVAYMLGRYEEDGFTSFWV